ncbi:hypothetical protein DSM112329_03295 [Paraconexibacter sp. AEG42_29]|uniref:Uncharacterized protein n=1 Tax=Paraconexibacter sp. AEG42_29 TaxID=2997339 RepID=A0AAU7AYD2_9ACTN
MSERILTRTERATARLATGAVAHFVCGLIDWVVLLGRFARAKLRGGDWG